MATKDHCLQFNGTHDLPIIGTISNRRYDNLNLNGKHQILSVESVHSNDFSKKSNKVQNYEKTAASPQLSDVTQRSEFSRSLKKSENSFPSKYLTLHSDSDKNESKKGKESSKSKNDSTLSLHIAAYENSVEAESNSFEGIIRSKEKSSNSFKSSKNVKHQNFSSAINNPFEFPRQQTNDSNDPAVMQFTASQKLLKPNQRNDNSVIAKKAKGSSVSSANHRTGGIQKREKDNNDGKAFRRVKKKSYKMMIRRLPFEMTEEELLQKLSPLPSHERFWFRKGEEYLEDDAFPYAFIVFNDFDQAAQFQKAYNGQLFVDSEGNESTVIVEKAANQDFSKESLKPKPGITPITEDIGFLQFLEEAESKSITKKVDFDVLVNEITERERRHAEGICQDTPLTDYFIKKVHEKIIKNRPKPKKPEQKGGAKIEKNEPKQMKAIQKDKKEKPLRGGAATATREPKNYRGDKTLPKKKVA